MTDMNWKQNEFGNYYSYHILLDYLGDKEPKYHVLKIDSDWVIGVFYGFIGGEYVPLEEEEEEERLLFETAEKAMNYVDSVLENGRN